MVRQSVAEAGPRAAAGGIELTCQADDVQPVEADRGRMFQLLDNLVSNAIKFTPPGGDVRVSFDRRTVPCVSRSRHRHRDPGRRTTPLFERFFRARAASEQQIPGTGLGLYIARAIVEAHGGSIAVRSEPGEGTSFRVDLPGHPVERAAADLVADDDADILALVRAVLERAGYEVVAVRDGAKALASVRERRPHLAVLDITMPELDGLEVLRRLRADPATNELPVVLLSAQAQEQTSSAALRPVRPRT